jgi:hypothetical protein
MLRAAITRPYPASTSPGDHPHVLPPLSNGRACLPARLATAILLLGLASLTGCFGPPLPTLTPVKGTVSVDSKPVTSGQVSFFATVVDEKTKFAPPSGQIDANGNYELFTEGKAGAPLGKYKVTVTPSMVPVQGAKTAPNTPYNDKYRDQKRSDLEVEVVAEPKPYDLKLKP